MKICHFSDLHLVPDRSVPLSTLLNKRALGYANLRLNRGRTHNLDSLKYLIEDVAKEAADCVVVSGDFTSLALPFEFETIHNLFLEGNLTPENTLVIPGNHDRYTFTADKLANFEQGLAAWLPDGFDRRSGYPIVRKLGRVLLLGLDTAVWRNPIRAAGALPSAQLSRLESILASPENRDTWPVIAMHHPPFHRGNRNLLHYRTGLAGYTRFLHSVNRPATVLHGHLHFLTRRSTNLLDIIGVSSASNDTGKPATQFAYHTYKFSHKGLLEAYVTRFWPDRKSGDIRRERCPLPEPTPIGGEHA